MFPRDSLRLVAPLVFALVFAGDADAQSVGAVPPARGTITHTWKPVRRGGALVFIDPVGTGFSRPFTTEAGRRRFWTRSGDAASVAEVIERWLRLHERERSPRYLAGESYGSVRAGIILRDHPALRFDGVILVAVVTGAITADESGTDAERVATLPTMAVEMDVSAPPLMLNNAAFAVVMRMRSFTNDVLAVTPLAVAVSVPLTVETYIHCVSPKAVL